MKLVRPCGGIDFITHPTHPLPRGGIDFITHPLPRGGTDFVTASHHIPKALLLVVVILLIATSAVAQRSGARSRSTPPARKPPIDYSRFSHSTKKHQAECSTCHKLPTKNWQRAGTIPDVADYPDHDACVSCHRAQFFRGARPAICTTCHTQAGPRANARLAFRNPRFPSEFAIDFPHDRHQDVIASRYSPRDQLPRSIFRSISFQEKPAPVYNNCAICHAERPTPPQPVAGWPDKYVPDALTFQSVPENHAACFSCHWKSQQPVGSDCDGCHRLSPGIAADAAAPSRISLKYKHAGGGAGKNHLAECTSCHINITKSESLRGLKPDVPIAACTECHNKDGLRLDVSGELARLDKDKDFVCSYCHTSNVGKLDPPASHYLIAERPPIKPRSPK